MGTSLAIYIFSKYLVLIILTVISSTGSEKYKCDYRYSAIAQGWFKYQEIPSNWYDARLRCALEGAILASPTTAYKLVVLCQLIKDTLADGTDYMEVFIGIHATIAKGDYTSIDGIPLSEIPHTWETSEPNNKNNREECLTLNSNNLFSDINCNKTLPYFCFKPQNLTEEMDDCGPIKPEYDYDKRTNSCYKFHTEPRTFSRAHLTCFAEGGYLTIINSDEEALVIKELFSKFPATTMVGNFDKDVAFVGVNKWGHDGKWRSIHGETIQDAGYATFASGEPNNSPIGGDDCGSVYRNAELNDVNCEEPHAFICEKNVKYPDVCSYIDGDDVVNDQKI